MRFKAVLFLFAVCLFCLPVQAEASGWNAGDNSVTDEDGAWKAFRTAMPGETVSCRAVFRVEGGREYVARSVFSEGVELDAVHTPRQNGAPVNTSAYTVLTGNAVRCSGFEIHFSSAFSSPGAITLEILYTVRLGDLAGEKNFCAVMLEGGNDHYSGTCAVISSYGFSVYRGIGIADSDKQINPLPGACYSLYHDREMTERVAFIQRRDGSYHACEGKTCSHAHHAFLLRTRENGTAVLKGLNAGTYYLLECRTPEGYRSMADGIEIVVSSNGEVTAGGVSCQTGKVELVERLTDNAEGRSAQKDPLAFYIYGNRILSAALSVMVLFRKKLFA